MEPFQVGSNMQRKQLSKGSQQPKDTQQPITNNTKFETLNVLEEVDKDNTKEKLSMIPLEPKHEPVTPMDPINIA